MIIGFPHISSVREYPTPIILHWLNNGSILTNISRITISGRDFGRVLVALASDLAEPRLARGVQLGAFHYPGTFVPTQALHSLTDASMVVA